MSKFIEEQQEEAREEWLKKKNHVLACLIPTDLDTLITNTITATIDKALERLPEDKEYPEIYAGKLILDGIKGHNSCLTQVKTILNDIIK